MPRKKIISKSAAPRAKRGVTKSNRPAKGSKNLKRDSSSSNHRIFENVLELKSTGGFKVAIRADRQLGAMSYFWNYVVRNRQRYSPESHQRLRRQSEQAFEEIGIDKTALGEIAERGFVEVHMPYEREEIGWDARIFPWESVLSLATKEWRGDRHLTVVRHLDGGARPGQSAPTAGSLLFVASAPGRLAREYNFDNEYRLVTAVSSGEAGGASEPLENPTRAKLQAQISETHPAIVHLSGVDAHQASAILAREAEETADAFLLADEAGQPDFVAPIPLAQALTVNGTYLPELVAFNCYYSASRLAALAVAAGAQHAIGFQDTIDDTQAEQFFAEFYRAWRAADWKDPLRAFTKARLTLSDGSNPQNGDVVLWTAESTLPSIGASFYAWVKGTPSTASSALSTAPAKTPTPLPDEDSIDIFVTPQVRPRLNYSLLHNNASLFTAFKVQKSHEGVNPEVEIFVELYVGEAAFPYRSVCRLKSLLTDFADQIRVPLVAGLLRGRRESIQTSLFIEVKRGTRTVHKSTERVTLLPADEWTDDEQEWRWLPSFVLPRDTAIGAILTHAERYLRALADNSGTAFDGYQRLLSDGSNPDVVDLQVRAIWSALLYETPLTYINPPPTYTQNSQRLRTPSMILEERRGTCIDLAVLFAGCLEYIGLLPVVFLIKGHAFPGYWRRPSDQATLGSFENVTVPPTSNIAVQPTGAGPVTERIPWVFQGPDAFREIARAVNAGGLVPIETVQLTQRGAFSQALELGIKNLATQWSFDALIDVQIARDHGVTPLPLFQNQL